MNISEFSVKKPITMLMLILSMVVLGMLALQRLPLTFYPDFSSTSINRFSPQNKPAEKVMARWFGKAVD